MLFSKLGICKNVEFEIPIFETSLILEAPSQHMVLYSTPIELCFCIDLKNYARCSKLAFTHPVIGK